MSITAQKQNRITGALVDEEILASSKSIFDQSRGAIGNMKGLQQYFTPLAVADFIATVIGPETPVIDTTAGSGSMLKGFETSYRYGIEIDPDHTAQPTYRAITGDAQRLVPMMRNADVTFPAVAINPPFGMEWTDQRHTKSHMNSTVLAYLWALDLLKKDGQGAMLSGTNRLRSEVMRHEKAKAIYAIVDITDKVWPTVDLPCSISFFRHPNNIHPANRPPEPERIETTLEGLLDTVSEVRRTRDRYSGHIPRNTRYHNDWCMQSFRAVKNEYERRRDQRNALKKTQTYDLELKGSILKSAPAAYAQLMLSKAGTLRQIEGLNGQHVNYFATSTKAWRVVTDAEKAGHITVSQALKDKIEPLMENTKLLATPLFPVKPQMRLGWITDLEKIECTKDDETRGFSAGSSYKLTTRYQVTQEFTEKPKEDKQGNINIKKYVEERKVLHVGIWGDKGYQTFTEGKTDIEYLMAHFDMPDPGSVKDLFPDQVASYVELLRRIETENGFTFKDFQVEHLSRLLTKGRGLLAHEQGLGKTLQLMACAEAKVRTGAENKVLFICPQDLIPQWKREAKKFFGRELVHIQTPDDAIRVSRELMEEGGEGWYITHYECLSLGGRKYEDLPTVPSGPNGPRKHLYARLEALKRVKKELADVEAAKKVHGVEWATTSPSDRSRMVRENVAFDPESLATTADMCPKCGNDTTEGWDGTVCHFERGARKSHGRQGCGYVHRRVMKKPSYRYLTHAFRKGVICVDELSEMRGDSLRSRAIRALNRGPFKFGGTGTPLSNYINDCFWGLWWTLGNATPAFPYAYIGGKAKFETDFCVIQHTLGDKGTAQEGNRVGKRVLPQVTNISQFWRLTRPGVSRCRKEDTGEPIVDRIFKPIRVPMGIYQKKAHDLWLMHFDEYFSEKNPDHALVKWGLVEKFAGVIGLRPKLQYAATMPTADVEGQKWEPAFEGTLQQMERLQEGISPWTPGTLKVLEAAIEHAKAGEKILIGSDMIAPGKWIADRLNEKGVKAVHLTEEKNGKTATKNPKKRSKEVSEFVEGDAQVMCAGIQSMKLGHNMDVASVVIVHGLPDSFMAMDQFLARVHRLTSKKEVTVYVILPKGSLAETKWDLLKDKGGSSDLAFDGELSDRKEEATDWAKILLEMKKRGIRAPSDEVLEEDVEAEWRKLPIVYCRPDASTIKDARPQPDQETLTKGSKIKVTPIKPKQEAKARKEQTRTTLFDTPVEDVSHFVQDSLFAV